MSILVKETKSTNLMKALLSYPCITKRKTYSRSAANPYCPHWGFAVHLATVSSYWQHSTVEQHDPKLVHLIQTAVSRISSVVVVTFKLLKHWICWRRKGGQEMLLTLKSSRDLSLSDALNSGFSSSSILRWES